jgi:hypothetical protein
MLSDKSKAVKKLPKRKLKDGKTPWGDAQKIEAVETFTLLNGNLKRTAIVLGVPRQTLQHWCKTEWWKDLYEEVKQQDNIVLSLRLQKVVARSLDLVEDRLEKGDIFYDQKLGQAVRKEVSLRDAHAIFKDSFLVKEQIERPSGMVLDAGSVTDKLHELAKQFEAFASVQKEKPKIEVTDVIYIEDNNAVHEEWEERLQDGESEVQLET